ncbi:MAG: hypothetical protein ACRDZ1_16535, partial [Acidimicrobiia bacterium]
MVYQEAPPRRCPACGFQVDDRARHCKMCYAALPRERRAKKQRTRAPDLAPDPGGATDSWGTPVSATPIPPPRSRPPEPPKPAE